jgi:hypothetical protein
LKGESKKGKVTGGKIKEERAKYEIGKLKG